MMIGVAQVIGMKPTASLVFSSGPDCAKASVAVAIGKICDERGRDGGAADGRQQRAARHRIGEGGAQHRGLDPLAQPGIAQAFAGDAGVVIDAAGAGIHAESCCRSLNGSSACAGRRGR